MGFFVSDDGSLGSLGFPWIYSYAAKGRRVHSEARGFTHALLQVSGFIWGSMGSLRSARDGAVNSDSSGFTRAHLGVVGFIRVYKSSLKFS